MRRTNNLKASLLSDTVLRTKNARREISLQKKTREEKELQKVRETVEIMFHPLVEQIGKNADEGNMSAFKVHSDIRVLYGLIRFFNDHGFHCQVERCHFKEYILHISWAHEFQPVTEKKD